jgi:hypothetical protein
MSASCHLPREIPASPISWGEPCGVN